MCLEKGGMGEKGKDAPQPEILKSPLLFLAYVSNDNKHIGQNCKPNILPCPKGTSSHAPKLITCFAVIPRAVASKETDLDKKMSLEKGENGGKLKK